MSLGDHTTTAKKTNKTTMIFYFKFVLFDLFRDVEEHRHRSSKMFVQQFCVVVHRRTSFIHIRSPNQSLLVRRRSPREIENVEENVQFRMFSSCDVRLCSTSKSN